MSRQSKFPADLNSTLPILLPNTALKPELSANLVLSGTLQKNISRARAVIAKKCTNELCLPLAEIARALGSDDLCNSEGFIEIFRQYLAS
jgi:hypothetical protein